MTTVLGLGAEATVTLDEKNVVVKDRSPKRYRHPQLDKELREARTKREAKILGTARTIVPAPHVLDATSSTIRMEHIAGPQLKSVLDEHVELVTTVGVLLARLHAKNIIHGDLTTSNMLLRDDEIVLIDFGLAFTSTRAEDKAVDIHLFRQALESRHHRIYEKAYKLFLKSYKTEYKKLDEQQCSAVLERLKQVELRGRNKAKY